MNKYNFKNFLYVIIIILIGCDKNPIAKNQNTTGNEIITSNINSGAIFYEMEDVSNPKSVQWDMKFLFQSWGYYIELNTPAGVMSVNSEQKNFEEAILPDSGLSYDNHLIGANWVDISTYNQQDAHSVETLGDTYFIWTTNYNFVKIQFLSAKTLIPSTEYQIVFKYQNLNETESLLDTVKYFKEIPTYYKFNTDEIIGPINWDFGFTLTPVFSEILNSYQNMPTVLLNMSAGVYTSVFDDYSFENQIDTSNVTWNTDSIDHRNLGYNGNYQVIWYHPEPPYNHKAIIEYPNRIYMLSNGSSLHKLQFSEYESGYLAFKYQ